MVFDAGTTFPNITLALSVKATELLPFVQFAEILSQLELTAPFQIKSGVKVAKFSTGTSIGFVFAISCAE